MNSNILKTVVEKIDPTAIIKIEGPFNDFQAKEISNIVDDLLSKRFIHFIINFEKSNELNSFGVSVLIDIIKLIEDRNGKLLFSKVDAHLEKKFTSMGLMNYVSIFDDDKEALSSLIVNIE